MTSQSRRAHDRGEHGSSWRAIPHYYSYPAAGAAIGLASPTGAFLLRYWIADPLLNGMWARHELDYNFLFYAYMSVGSAVAFMIFGYVIGLRSERQRVRNRVLSARVDELHLKSVTDALTGTFTHGYLQEILEIEIQHSLTHKTQISAMIIDIDDFKRINDSHGHLFGDRVLKESAETISANVRSNDILGRYGGDEFVVIMPGADAATACTSRARARRHRRERLSCHDQRRSGQPRGSREGNPHRDPPSRGHESVPGQTRREELRSRPLQTVRHSPSAADRHITCRRKRFAGPGTRPTRRSS